MEEMKKDEHLEAQETVVEEAVEETMETVAKAGSKAKDFLSNIFPFED